MQAAANQTAEWGDHHLWQWQGWNCHWRVCGPTDGKPILLLHGFGASSGHWRRCAPHLVDLGWRVYGLDLLGFGASDQPSSPLDNRIWGLQVSAFLNQVVGSPAVLVGNSLGALTALTAAVLTPSRIRAVVAAPLPDPALLRKPPQRQVPWQRRWQRRLLWLVLHLLPLELIVPLIARTPLLKVGLQGAYLRPVGHDRELLRLIAVPARRPTAAGALRGMSLGMGCRPWRFTAPELLRRLQSPMLLIWGRQDRFVPLAIGEKVASENSKIDLAVINGCGHCPHDETSEQFLDVMLNWLDRNLG